MEKYKHAESEGWYYYIDQAGNKSASWNKKNKPGMYTQMQEWVDAGNEIEPEYTAEEQEAKEIEDARQKEEAKTAAEKKAVSDARIMKGDLEIKGSTTEQAITDARAWYQTEISRIDAEYV